MIRTLLRCILIVVFSGVLNISTTAHAQPIPAEREMLVLILHPLSEIYEGDTFTVPYTVEELNSRGLTLAPLTPGTASVTASLGSASVEAKGLSGSITYTAEKVGQESIVLTVGNYFGAASGSLEFEVKPRPNYDLNFLVVSQDSDASGAAFLAVFTGEGEFAYDGESAPQGKGSSDLWMSLWVENEALFCKLDPVVRGSSAFAITDSMPLAALVRDPNGFAPFFLDLNFQPMALNASTMACQGLGGFSMNFPFPGGAGNPDDFGMKGLYFPSDGGAAPVSAPKTWGYVWVERKSQ